MSLSSFRDSRNSIEIENAEEIISRTQIDLDDSDKVIKKINKELQKTDGESKLSTESKDNISRYKRKEKKFSIRP